MFREIQRRSIASGLACLLVLASSSCASAPRARRFAHPVHVSEVVALSQYGVHPDQIIEKMNRGGLVYSLTDEEYVEIRERGVTPQVIAYMQGTYAQAVAKFPKIANDPNLGCWYLGPDGHWYAGGPDGFHPDC